MALGLFWFLVGWQILGLILTASIIDKPRKPLTYSTWFVSVAISALIIVALFIWGNAL